MITSLLLVGLLGLPHPAPAPQKVAPAPASAPTSPPARVRTPSAKPVAGEIRYGEREKLFNGKDLDGWKPFLPNGEDPKGTWSVKDGVLICVGQPIGYLRTEKTYENFELEVEWRFDPEKGPGNSGVLLRVQPPDEVWPKSIEAQLHSGNAGDIWNIGEFPMTATPARTEGRRTRKEHPSSEVPLGEWNRYRIVMNGGELKLFVNNVLQNVAYRCEVVPGFIALQSEGAHIEFRKVDLRPILAASSPNAGNATAD
jgi:hypothetical protein